MIPEGGGRFAEPYDPMPDIIQRAEHRRNGIDELKDVADLALSWHAPKLTWVTDGSKDPGTGETLWKVATVCECGTGEFPCPKRQRLTAIFGVTEDYR